MAVYLTSLRRLLTLDLALILPGHGPPIERPYDKIEEYLAHRLLRERQILAVRAHLEKLIAEGVVTGNAADGFRLTR